ncbi:MAG: methionine--tRNA ligase [Victivallaceae bacterium]|nr:methionine--tRNA ligase [Victivallaceae bacterium]MDD3117233.1 methionine--tRNA ligase [Victivallaceae bacterium]MDD3702647.1 methionine--tRNA ligase [Victivallaceae bacterium]MDD5663142.1 methionine--tRNA ligase [Victivallaceae bacterium]
MDNADTTVKPEMFSLPDKYYLTTPIYYVNDKPHIGHSYTTILGDILARYHRSENVPTFFLTGTDEHGQKVQRAAEAKGITPQEQCDTTVVRFQELWKRLGISNDDFIRTTQPNHKKVVQEILQDLFERGEIYKDHYKGYYCVPCERFFTTKDLKEDRLCPECGRETSEITESNYFFRMGKYQDWLIEYIKTHPLFIRPVFRANETLGFLKSGKLGDLCISRPKARLSWGIELPFDTDYVCYVWFDALINYISGVGYRQDDEKFKKWWPASCHLIGKDILTTHTVYWPTMLKAMGVEIPQTIFAHGWWLIDDAKMSKSTGNVVNPMDMIDLAGVDAFRYFLISAMTPGQDASFSQETFMTRYNSDLVNDLGNLLSRVIKMTLRVGDGVIPQHGEFQKAEYDLAAAVDNAIVTTSAAVDTMRLDYGMEQVMNAVRAGNRYLEQTAPWTLAKKGETERLNTVLYCSAELLRIVSILLDPVMPEKMAEIRYALGLSKDQTVQFNVSELRKFNSINVLSGLKVRDIDALFPRYVLPEKVKSKPVEMIETNTEGVALIGIEDFSKVQLLTAKVLEAAKVDGADKLLRLNLEVGVEKRQIVSGIARFYTPEQLIGKLIVLVANLKPAKIRGVESQGMLLCAKGANGDLKIITVDGEFSSGASVG